MKLLGFIVGAAMLGAVNHASASTLTVDFTVSGGWVGSATGPFGLSANPTLSGDVVIDTTKSDGTAFIGINWVTGSHTFTLSDIDIAHSDVTYSGGNFQNFALEFSFGNYFFSNNTVSIDDGTHLIACNDCVSISSTPIPAALPLFASGLGAMGLLGWRRKRKNIAAIAAA